MKNKVLERLIKYRVDFIEMADILIKQKAKI